MAAQPKRIKRRGKGRFEPRKAYINGTLFWQVNLPGHVQMRDGREVRVRGRKSFRDRKEAEIAAEQARIMAKNSGMRSFAIPEELRVHAVAAAKILKPFGASLEEAAKFYSEHLQLVRSSEKVSVVLKEFLAAKQHDNLRPRYLNDLRVRLTRFCDCFQDRQIATITAGEIDAWLRGLLVRPLTRNTFRLRVSAVFEYAIRRGWCQKNPATQVPKLRLAPSPICVLSPEQFAKLLEAASERTLPYWLLGGFAGLRRAELERLEWTDIRFKSALIEVPALKAKTASRRFVPIQPNLAAWLQPYQTFTGVVCPPNLRKLVEADRANAGLKHWPPNALRHSFASYHLAHFQDAAKLALALGHARQELIFRHYRELVTPEDGARYWSIWPATEAVLSTRT